MLIWKWGWLMDKKEILARVDHTLLAQTAGWEDIRQVLDDAVQYGTASACIPPAYVKQAAEADRLGTSRLVKLMKQEAGRGND